MVYFSPLDLVVAWGLDALIGDPPALARYHPIVMIGRLISAMERCLYKDGEKSGDNLLRGGILAAVVVAATFIAAISIIAVSGSISPLLGHLASILVAWSCIATRDLARQAGNVSELANGGELPKARAALGMIVGRDTDHLEPAEINRGAFETVAENSSDGVIAPLFFLVAGGLLGVGPALGLAYKAVNTLDSMVGYKNERYRSFGTVSALTDDLLNWVPARLTVLLVAIGAEASWGKGAEVFRIVKRDGTLHASPNSGYPEAAYAGALGVRLGGVNSYGGVEKSTPYIGDGDNPITVREVRRAIHLTWLISIFAMVTGTLLLLLFQP